MPSIYRNRTVINQRGGSITINNTTENESVHITHRSGSNVTLNNVVNSELATNNKQLNVVNDKFETVGGDSSTYIGKDQITRVAENSYAMKGFISDEQLDMTTNWKNEYAPIAALKSKFKIKRGGSSFPNGTESEQSGDRSSNPVLENSKVISVENKFHGYTDLPFRTSYEDQVTSYEYVPDRGNTKGADTKSLTESDITKSAGTGGSNAPGVVKYGASKSAATEDGSWELDQEAYNVDQVMLEFQDNGLNNFIEQSMGNGGDDTNIIKRNKFDVIGTTFNDYPSVRIDPEGRSQPLEILVSDTGAYKNHDFIPHVEEVDNSSNFPGGEYTQIVSNKYNLSVGSGGLNVKSTGGAEFGGTVLKMGYNKINMNASAGVCIGSESHIELQSIKSITLRTNRQVLIDGALGVNHNMVVKGGTYTEGETYLQHITAPLEVQQTEDVLVSGRFAALADRILRIGEVYVNPSDPGWSPVFAVTDPDLLFIYPHSHHFNNVPLRLTSSNADVRKLAQQEGVNNHLNVTQALAQNHERKQAVEVS